MHKVIDKTHKVSKPKHIAIIGSGISGQTCGYVLSQRHHITLFEANDYLGGHTATVDVLIDGKTFVVDTGFIVFNDRTYPNFIKMMDQVGIRTKPTEMSFSVHHGKSGLEYNGHNLNTLFAQRRNLFKPKFYRFIAEILRFNKLATKANLADDGNAIDTLGSFLDRYHFGDYFTNHYILPMTAAIWSSPIVDCRDFPLRFFLQFFDNHGLLSVTNRPQWYVLEGGSRNYIPCLTRSIQDIRIGTPVQSVCRREQGVDITSQGQTETFDEVIFACHSDQALELLSDATTAETEVLSAIPYRQNDVVLHTDTTLLPHHHLAHASWNYCLGADTSHAPAVTYIMNILQGLESERKICVTLNQTEQIDPAHILRTFQYAHPVFTLESVAAQGERHRICGHLHTHFCGAYWYNGFHEDGVRSALDICQRFGLSLDGETA